MSIVGVGIVVGIVSAALGIGGGALMVPYFVEILGLGQHLAEGTSLAAVVPIALVGSLAHRHSGLVRYRLALLLASGGIPGAFLGSRLAFDASPLLLQRLFGVALVVIALMLLVSSRRSAPT